MAFIAKKNVDRKLLKTIEEKLKINLPKDYTNFLLNYGGFYVRHPNYIEFEIEYLDDPFISPETLYGDNLIEINEELLYLIEGYANAIIIGRDGGTNFLMLDKDTGEILYWDYDNVHTYKYKGNNRQKDIVSYTDNDEDESPRIYRVFNSFEELESKINHAIDSQKGEIIEE